MKYLKVIVIVCGILLFFSCLLTIFVTFTISGNISDVLNKNHFVKMVVKIETKEKHGGRSQSVSSYCVIKGKKLAVNDAYEDDVEIDKYYYVWYNTKTEMVFLTDRKSQYFDAYGRLFRKMLLEFTFIALSLLLFFTIRFIGRRVV